MNRLGLTLSLMPVMGGVAEAAPPPERSAHAPPAWKQSFERLGVRDPRVLAAVEAVPREAFLEPEVRASAWEDRPLPIGYGQTTSQPSLIAFTIQAARPGPACRVLEVGTGCGYQTALLAKLCPQVYSIDIVEPLAERAKKNLAKLGVTNAQVKAGDGYLGWPEAAPFDIIIVAAGASRVPQPLLEQLAVGGRLVIPVGDSPDDLSLDVLTKQKNGSVTTERLFPVRFVPLTGSHADRDRADSGWR
ncbi:MAG: protein-L-isoaspartate(D-aspartate) O-methyltransferase [Myxococcales bacterium]|nr:protein-L-isoaspartate(D-aspartate) O-methyltransferase [Myxococcales bacterium]